MINDDLTVHGFSLKQIIENLDKIPEKTGKFGEPSNQLSKEEKKKLHELMRKFNEYGKALRGDQALMETAKNLSEISSLAEKYVMSENNNSDFIQKDTAKRDFKGIKNITSQFQNLAKECVSHLMQLNALYEDAGNIYERYFEVENINEIGLAESPKTNLEMSECGTCGCGNPHDDHGIGHGEEQEEYASGFEEQTIPPSV